jgi:hypothetical protein
LDERSPQGNQADTQASVGETTQTEEVDGNTTPTRLKAVSLLINLQTHRSKSGNVAYEMDSKVFIAELPALDVPGSSDTKHVYGKQGVEDGTITVGTRLDYEKQINSFIDKQEIYLICLVGPFFLLHKKLHKDSTRHCRSNVKLTFHLH